MDPFELKVTEKSNGRWNVRQTLCKPLNYLWFAHLKKGDEIIVDDLKVRRMMKFYWNLKQRIRNLVRGNRWRKYDHIHLIQGQKYKLSCDCKSDGATFRRLKIRMK
jgi:hypothetical protein